MDLTSEDYLGHCVDVVTQGLVEQKGLRDLEVVEVLEEGFELVLENFVELMGHVSVDFCAFTELLDALREESELFEELLEDLDVLVLYWLVEEVVQAESTGYD